MSQYMHDKGTNKLLSDIASATPVNFAENQERWDRGEVSPAACYRKGQEHAAYGWAHHGLGFPGNKEQRAAYDAGFAGKPMSIGVSQ